jgi:small-conductance mechanosensitive channel
MDNLLQALQEFYNTTVALFIVNTLPGILKSILGAAAALVGGIYILRLVNYLMVTSAKRARIKPALIDLMSATIMGAGWVLIASAILSALNLNELSVAIGASISLVALGIATAASGNLGDIIAGVFLASDPDFGTGYTIKSGDLLGTIERIDLRKTRLRGEDGKLHIVPNKSIENTVWTVVQRPATPLSPAPRKGGFPFVGRGKQQGGQPSAPVSIDQPAPPDDSDTPAQ